MANLNITAANVLPSDNAIIEHGVAGVAIAAGDVLYRDTSDSNKLKLADANDASAIVRAVRGIAVNSAAAGQRVSYVTEDSALTLGTGLVAIGDGLILSATPGKIAPEADLASGMYRTNLGIAVSTAAISFKPFAVAVAKA